VKPSWAVTKLIDAIGRRLSFSYRSDEPVKREANSPRLPDGVAVLAVPLGPQRREAAHLVAALAHVPRLGDQLDLADHRVLVDQVEERGEPVDRVELPGQRRGEVEAEAVDVHLEHPVPQRVHDQPQGLVRADVEAVPGAGGVVVELRLVGHHPVVVEVVDAAERQRRAEVVALGGVVVDHVEDDLDPRPVQLLDHRLELLHLLAAGAEGRVVVVRGEEADGVVAPVVAQAALLQRVVVHELVHRHELDRGDAQVLQVLDHHRVDEPRVRPPDLLGDVRVRHRHALDVRLVDHRLVVGDAQRAVPRPVEERVHHHRPRHVRRRVGGVERARVPEPVAEDGLVPAHVPVDGLGVRVQQQLRRVAAQPGLRLVRPVHAEPVALSRPHARQVAVPDESLAFGQVDPGLPIVLVEQTQFDALRDLGEQCEVRAATVVVGAQWIGRTGPDLHQRPPSGFRCGLSAAPRPARRAGGAGLRPGPRRSSTRPR